MPEMKAALGTRVDVTVFRKLATLPYRSSYSHRGAYYTLESIAQFDRQGLWGCRRAWFSCHGTLRETARVFVSESPAGFFAGELEAVLHVPVQDCLHHLVQANQVRRHDFQGLYLYTAKDHLRRQEQRAARQAQWEAIDEQDHQLHAAIALFYSLLDEQQRRFYAGLESFKQGHGGDRSLSQALGLNEETVARGRRELLTGQVQQDRVRRRGGGRPRAEKKRPKSSSESEHS